MRLKFHLRLHCLLLYALWLLLAHSSFWLSILLKGYLASILGITTWQNCPMPSGNERNTRCVETTLQPLKEMVLLVTDGSEFTVYIWICGPSTPRVCTLQFVSVPRQQKPEPRSEPRSGQVETLKETILTEFRAYQSDNPRLPVFVFCLHRSRMSLEPARPLT